MLPLIALLALASLPDGADALHLSRTLAAVQQEASACGLILALDSRDDGPYRQALDAAGKVPELSAWVQRGDFSEPRWDTGRFTAISKREGWTPGPGWAVLDRQGKVVAHGTRPPTMEELRDALAATGSPSPDEVVLAFLREHPDREDAWQCLFDQTYRAGVLGMTPLLDGVDPYHPTLKRELDFDTDQRLWSQCAKALGHVAAAGGWRAYSMEPMGEFLMAGRYWSCSPLMREEARRCLPGLASFLEGHPESMDAWCFWLTFAEAVPEASLPGLLDTLAPRPGCPQWPLDQLESHILRAQARGEAWNSLPRLRKRSEEALAEAVDSWGAIQEPKRRGTVWEGAVLPCLEELLKAGQDEEADALLSRALRWSKGESGPYLDRALDLARANGRTYIAERWQGWRASVEGAYRAPAGSEKPTAKREPPTVPIPTLEAFLQKHPEKWEAYADLLAAQLKRAAQRTAAIPPSPPSGDLGEAEDEALWGPSAKLLAMYFQDEAYRLLPTGLDLPEAARRSPAMRRIASQLLPQVERWIERDPRWPRNWMAWVTLDRLAGGGSSLAAVMERCPPLPGEALAVPPDALVAVSAEARLRRDWQGIVDRVDPAWEAFMHTWLPPFPQPSEGSPEFRQRTALARRLVVPLVEAFLCLKQFQAAERTVQDLLARISSRELLQELVGLARAANRPDMAARWSHSVGAKERQGIPTTGN
jgi:hypothetical protein